MKPLTNRKLFNSSGCPIIPKLLYLCLLGLTFSTVTAQEQYQGEVRVIDGDTLEFYGSRTKIRLSAIDSPELSQTCQDAEGAIASCGRDSKAALEHLTAQKQVVCHRESTDAYQRWIATCWTKDTELNATMVLIGQALAFRKYDTRYIPHEHEAQNAGRGIWRYEFLSPWDYRAKQKKDALARSEAPQDPSCNIKGNINRQNQKIYHLPGTRSYDATSIRVNQGERYFCTEEEALQAGWRSPN